jgi:Ca-activated chloride channel family protein
MVFMVLVAMLSGCTSDESRTTFRLLSSSENLALEPLIQEFAKRDESKIEVTYMGSVDIMRELANGADSTFDAVWPANGIWIQLGDTTGAVQLSSSIMRSPIVLGVKKSVAERLGWIGADVSVGDLLAAAEAGEITFMMANPTQSDSGAAAYLGFLYAFAGQPDVLTSAHLNSPDVQDKITRILGSVERTAGSSGFLSELFIADYDSYDAMINQEAAIIETNQKLIKDNREPLYALYLRDGTAIADWPLAFIDKGDTEQRETFLALQEWLLSPDTKQDLLALGRRAGISIVLNPASIDPAVFNPDWGIDTQRILTPIKVPESAVVTEALSLYQGLFRKPSFTVYALDFSGSMGDAGQDELTAAMRQLLDQDTAGQYLLQASPNDITVVIPFNDKVLGETTVIGNNATEFTALIEEIERLTADGGTNIYAPVIAGLEVMRSRGLDGYFPSIVLLTDGKSNNRTNIDSLKQFIADTGMDSVPVFAITFGNASEEQLQEIADFTSGAVFDGRQDLIGAFRTVRGYN